ncbi:hypothetical protein [Cetobacterium sp.]|uniref:hypothetical protein n=1 Tax=Cetobacterium sp. TaxID=2071632 RepID=UPI003F2BE81F
MAGVKGMKSGGFSTGRPLSENPKKNQVRVTDKEKELLEKIRNKASMKEIQNLIEAIQSN